jgi:ATP-dependent DNA ligase
MTYGLIGGEQQTKYETIETNQSGRTISEQMLSRMSSRVSKQRDKGYVDKYDVAVNNKSTNTLNLPKPMLAQPIKNVVVPVSYYVQNKYDGNRCLITKQNGKVFAYSRNGKIIGSIDHILSEAKDIPERRILDGELYCHGVALQTIRSWISRSQEESKKLIYICYDIMSSDIYSKRLEALKKLNLNPPIYIAETTLISPKESLEYDIFSELKEAISRGYEGLILRNPDTPYEDGKRSKGLIKVKAFDDGEFKVIDVIPSADG